MQREQAERWTNPPQDDEADEPRERVDDEYGMDPDRDDELAAREAEIEVDDGE